MAANVESSGPTRKNHFSPREVSESAEDDPLTNGTWTRSASWLAFAVTSEA